MAIATTGFHTPISMYDAPTVSAVNTSKSEKNDDIDDGRSYMMLVFAVFRLLTHAVRPLTAKVAR